MEDARKWRRDGQIDARLQFKGTHSRGRGSQKEKKVALNADLREIRRQLDRARELLSQSDRAIAHWERRLKDGFGDIGGGFPDLMAANKRVSDGGRSSFARNPKKKRSKGNDGGEEE